MTASSWGAWSKRSADSAGVRVTIEVELPPAQVDIIIEDARSKLEALDRSPHVARRLEA